MKSLISRYTLKSLLFLSLVVTAFSNSITYAEVKAYLNQESAYQGDIITLRIEANNNIRAAPDLSALEKDFEIKGASSSSQINLNTGSINKIWTIELQANLVGELTIPAIKVGNETTEDILLTINELPPEITKENSKHVFIEASVDITNDEIYVQQQIPYEIKLYYDDLMNNGEIIVPTIENANITPVGNDKRYKTSRNGKEFIVVERRYLISPEKSGNLLIPPAKIEGRLKLSGNVAPSKRRNDFDRFEDLFSRNSGFFSNSFDPFGRRQQTGPTRPFTMNSKAISVNVLPVPDSFTGNAWLPAEEIIMQDSWTLDPPVLKAGEPVTRTIIMQVKGLASSQIPDIEIPKSVGIKAYPEKSESQTPNDGNTVYGIQRVNITYIPEKQGLITIPSINIDWWNVNNKQQQTYTLPEWKLSVAAGDNVGNEINNEIDSSSQIIENKEDQIKTPEEQVVSQKWQLGTVFSIIASALIVLISIIIFIKRYKNSSRYLIKEKQRTVKLENKKIRTALLEACTKGDNKTSSELLIKYALLNS